jgi:hypothetical protein
MTKGKLIVKNTPVRQTREGIGSAFDGLGFQFLCLLLQLGFGRSKLLVHVLVRFDELDRRPYDVFRLWNPGRV